MFLLVMVSPITMNLNIFFISKIDIKKPMDGGKYNRFGRDTSTSVNTNVDFEDVTENIDCKSDCMNKVTSEEFRKQYTDCPLKVSEHNIFIRICL